jgi:outer membrane protein OmpA-like peptidoglycan-associated protein
MTAALAMKRGLPAAMLLAALAAVQPAKADCNAIDEAARAALQTADVGAYGDLLAQARADASCDSAYRSNLSRVLALSAFRKLTEANANPSTAEIEKVAALAAPWQVMITLGDAYYDAKDYPKAFRAYEAALDDMRDETANPTRPPADLERHAYQRAIQARALAPTFIASRSTRGIPSGLASPKFRNFTAEAVPIPVGFAYDSADLTPDGTAAAQEILAYLQAGGYSRVVLIGHTDPKGSEAYNLALSERRAAAVRDYLVAAGYTGAIEIAGRGEYELFKPDDPSRYSEPELDAMSRRVEYKTD